MKTSLANPRLRAFLVDLGLFSLAIFHGLVVLRTVSDLTIVLTVIGALGIFARHRHPMASLLVAIPGLFIADGVVAPVVAIYSLALKGAEKRVLIPSLIVVNFGYWSFWREWPSLRFATLIVTYSLALSFGAVVTGMLVRTRRELSDSIGQLQEAQAQDMERVARDVRSAERSQLAREMHDVVSHQVSLIAVQAGALQVTATDPETARTGSVIRTLAVRTIEELRQMVSILRVSGSSAQELTPQFTIGDIDNLVTESGLEVELKVDVPDDLPASVQRAVYRTVQEGLSNARKYAPGATVRVDCSASMRTLLLMVENDPPDLRPKEVPSTRHGHVGLVERAELIGGNFEAGPTDGGGYLIRLTVPMN